MSEAIDAAVVTSPELSGPDGTLNLSLLLSVPRSPPEMYHPQFWFTFSLIMWVLLHIYIVPVYAKAGDLLYYCYKFYKKLRGQKDSGVLNSEQSWGTRYTQAYQRLSTSKKAYWRRLFRSFIYYFFAVIFGFYFLLGNYKTIVDLYLIYTPGMDIAFCFAASHFIWCCAEDWPCRFHMGKSKCEQLAVFWGYIVHHVLTAGAYLMACRTQQFASMCLMGLTFEGPVFFGCLRELVSLFDEDFNLFDRVPAWLLKLNWVCAFVSLLPCRYVSIGFFLYSAIFWRTPYLQLVMPSVRVCYWTFGTLFMFINLYFTWLLTYWYGQDKRYVKKKRAKQAALKAEQEKNAQNGGIELTQNAVTGGDNNASLVSPLSSASSPSGSPLGVDSPHPVQRLNAAAAASADSQVQVVTHKA